MQAQKKVSVFLIAASLGMMIAGVVFIYREYDDVLHGGPNGTRLHNATSLRCLRYSKDVGEEWVNAAVVLLTFQIVAAVVIVWFALGVICGAADMCCGKRQRSPTATILFAVVVLSALIVVCHLLAKQNQDCTKLMTGLLLVLCSSLVGIMAVSLACFSPKDNGESAVFTPLTDRNGKDTGFGDD